MTFSEISSTLLSYDNCSLLIKTESGELFVQDLHATVRVCAQTIAKIENPQRNRVAGMIKENLKLILDNYHKARRLPPNSKRPK